MLPSGGGGRCQGFCRLTGSRLRSGATPATVVTRETPTTLQGVLSAHSYTIPTHWAALLRLRRPTPDPDNRNNRNIPESSGFCLTAGQRAVYLDVVQHLTPT